MKGGSLQGCKFREWNPAERGINEIWQKDIPKRIVFLYNLMRNHLSAPNQIHSGISKNSEDVTAASRF